MNKQIPTQVQLFFWGDNLDELNWPEHKKYIIQTVLDKGNIESLKWLFTKTSRLEILHLLPQLKLQPKSRNFWQIYLS